MTGTGSQSKQHERTLRICRTAGCSNKAEPKDRYCVACQLAGKAPLDGRRGK
jgi:hypothetical protein